MQDTIFSCPHVRQHTKKWADGGAETGFLADFPVKGFFRMLAMIDTATWKKPPTRNLGECRRPHLQDFMVDNADPIRGHPL
jgi:hypothetical protein